MGDTYGNFKRLAATKGWGDTKMCNFLKAHDVFSSLGGGLVLSLCREGWKIIENYVGGLVA